MFNLNIPPSSLLTVDSGGLCSTPKTPEIVNSLIAMTTNPLDNYNFNNMAVTINNGNITGTNNLDTTTNGIVIATQHQQQHQQSNFKNNNNNNNNSNNNNTNNNNNNNNNNNINNNNNNNNNNNISNNANQQFLSQDSSHSSCSGSPLDSPAGNNTTPSVQQTCSQLIKAGLKLTIQSKRKISSGDSSSGNEQHQSQQPPRKYARKSNASNTSSSSANSRHDVTSNTGETSDDSNADHKPSIGLTPEDEDRRRRRRERNKIAATKCRMKKRERTINLVSESETLETQNIDLRAQVKSLELERRSIFDMLQTHACVHPGGYQPPLKLCQSPAFKYLKSLSLLDEDESNSNNNDVNQPRTVIPPVNTIKYSRNNGMRQQHQHHQQQQQQQQQQQPPQHQQLQHLQHQNNLDILPNGYCKPSPNTHELGYINSPTQDLNTCHLQQALTTMNHQQQPNHLNHHLPSLMKSDYIPNCENSNGGTTVDSTTDFVLKSELGETQSPYTTDKSAERFLCETDFTSFDIKHDPLNNNNLNSHNHNSLPQISSSAIDFHQHLAGVNNVQNYDQILLTKTDFLAHDSELLAQLTGDPESEFVDLDTGVSAYIHLPNGGCLA